jgi:hypothetical protein
MLTCNTTRIGDCDIRVELIRRRANLLQYLAYCKAEADRASFRERKALILSEKVPALLDVTPQHASMGQPEHSPMALPQLKAEINGHYASLMLVEAKCIQIDAIHSYTAGQWQALINLHRTLLYEHHDFLMVIRHSHAYLTVDEDPAMWVIARLHKSISLCTDTL